MRRNCGRLVTFVNVKMFQGKFICFEYFAMVAVENPTMLDNEMEAVTGFAQHT